MFLRAQAFGGSLLLFIIRVWKSSGLNLRLLCSARKGKSVDRLVMINLNDQKISFYSSSQKLDEDRKREGRPKSPALELCADSTANFLL